MQSGQSLCSSLEYSIIVKLLAEYHLEFLSLKAGYRGSSESTLVKMPHCWKSHALAQIKLLCQGIKLVLCLVIKEEKLLRYEYFVRIPTSFKIP